MAWLRDFKSLQTTTILIYKASLKVPLFGSETLDTRVFEEIRGSLVLERARKNP